MNSSKYCLALLLPLLLLGCGGKKITLEPGGPYGQDTYLYQADLVYSNAVQTIQDGMKWEYNNREYLWNISPGIKRVFDTLRVELPKAEDVYRSARKAYIEDPIDPNRATMDNAVSIVKSLLTAMNNALEHYKQEIN